MYCSREPRVEAPNSRPRPFSRILQSWRQAIPWNEPLLVRPRLLLSSPSWYRPMMPRGSPLPVLKDTFNSHYAIRWTPSRTRCPLPIPEVFTDLLHLHPRNQSPFITP